jgi:hypothetical protein
MLLHIDWYGLRPDRDEGMAIFEDFLATNAVWLSCFELSNTFPLHMHVHSYTQPLKVDMGLTILQEIETALNDRTADPQRLW